MLSPKEKHDLDSIMVSYRLGIKNEDLPEEYRNNLGYAQLIDLHVRLEDELGNPPGGIQ